MRYIRVHERRVLAEWFLKEVSPNQKRMNEVYTEIEQLYKEFYLNYVLEPELRPLYPSARRLWREENRERIMLEVFDPDLKGSIILSLALPKILNPDRSDTAINQKIKDLVPQDKLECFKTLLYTYEELRQIYKEERKNYILGYGDYLPGVETDSDLKRLYPELVNQYNKFFPEQPREEDVMEDSVIRLQELLQL